MGSDVIAPIDLLDGRQPFKTPPVGRPDSPSNRPTKRESERERERREVVLATKDTGHYLTWSQSDAKEPEVRVGVVKVHVTLQRHPSATATKGFQSIDK